MAQAAPSGIPARDTKVHRIIINYLPDLEGGEYVMKAIGTFAHGNGDWIDERPTDHYFYAVDVEGNVAADWVFDTFEVGGMAIKGLAISPSRGITIDFANSDQTAVHLANECNADWFRHEWFAYLRNTSTGERIVIKPGGQNGGGPGSP